MYVSAESGFPICPSGLLESYKRVANDVRFLRATEFRQNHFTSFHTILLLLFLSHPRNSSLSGEKEKSNYNENEFYICPMKMKIQEKSKLNEKIKLSDGFNIAVICCYILWQKSYHILRQYLWVIQNNKIQFITGC